ncbi:linear amide C-N hydrolase [Xanthobacter sp. AM11]|uniref:linear amide C-N hydrolase n=1 Tax=Xanthobacter sp. AM11 TaxID=3380643 RepID=UPI0039BEF5E0
MKKQLKRMCAAVCSAVLAAPIVFSGPAAACTSFLLGTTDGGFVYGRTMEFSLPFQSQALVIPRNLAITGTGPTGEAGTGLPWTTRYGAVGLNGLGLPVLIDGMNEKGLAGGMLYLPGVAGFQEVAPGEAKTSIASFEMLTYVLTSFATVAEVKAALPKIKVNRAPQSVFKMPVPVHMTLHDASGASLVVEYVGGVLTLHDNPTTVLTNAPTFDWQIANLGQYVNLSPVEPKPIQVGGLTLGTPSTGGGLHGLPGDMLSPSRFVRAFLFTRNAPKAPNGAAGVTTAFHILNNFDIPPGAVVTSAGSAAGGGVSGYETTEWIVAADLKGGRYHFVIYDNPARQVIDISRLDLDAKAMKSFPIDRTVPPLEIGR